MHNQCVTSTRSAQRSGPEIKRALDDLGLKDIDLDSCEVSESWKEKLLQVIEKYETIFSHHKMDCGEAKDFVHRIHLLHDSPFRLPYRRVPPSHYQKLKTALDEMEVKGIIRKPKSE